MAKRKKRQVVAAAEATETDGAATKNDKNKNNNNNNNNNNNTDANTTIPDLVSDCEKLRQYLLNAKGLVSKDSKALRVALESLRQLELSNGATIKNGSSKNGHHVDVGGSNDEAVPISSVVKIVASSSSTTTTTTSSAKSRSSWIVFLLRSALLDFPLWLLFALLLSVLVFQRVTVNYYVPQLRLMKWDDYPQKGDEQITYYDRECSIQDITANSTAELLIPEHATTEECQQHMLVHGVSVYQNLLKPSTANAVRQYIMERNKVEEGFYVIENEKRKSFGLTMKDPSIQQAWKEIASHPQLRPAMDSIMGEDPAVIEFTAITSMYGAADQFHHQDVVVKGSGFKYARNFVPSYALFVAVQDTTQAMGATEVCPGTHMCNDYARDLCARPGVSLKVSSSKTGNVWKKGHAALVNQQTIHRGTAHTDRFGGDRVLFIVTFAPRYNTNLETRLIGQGGSYSLLWNYWGHTLDDFGASADRMMEPWLSLRSMGFYKPRDANWGWDFITVASMRIANNDNGYSREDLHDFQQRGGFHFLPTSVQAFDVLDRDEEASWTEFLTETVNNTVNYVRDLNLLVFAAYFGLLILYNVGYLVLQTMRGQQHKNMHSLGSFSLVRAVVRLLWWHGITAFVWYLMWRHIRSTNWAQNIQHRRAFHGHRTVKRNRLPPALPAHSAITTPNKLPSTLAFESDVLVDTRYSLTLESYQNLLRWAHPANRLYHQFAIDVMSYHYRDLSPTLQLALINTVLNFTRLDNVGRFLTQNEDGNWAELPDATRQVHFDLAKADASVPVLSTVLTYWEYLRTETKVGRLREYIMTQYHTTRYLEDLLDMIIGKPNNNKNRHSMIVTSDEKTVVSSNTSASFRLQPLASKPTRVVWNWEQTLPRAPRAVPTPYQEAEPYPGAWANEGDTVEAQYHGQFNEWYRAKIIVASANDASYDVQYDDGEMDHGLCRLCIRPFRLYSLSEAVAIRVNGEYYEGRIVRVHENGNGDEPTYTVDTNHVGRQRKVTIPNIRRFDYRLTVGVAVEAVFYGEGTEWYRARIINVHPDGHFDLEYEDGDRENYVSPKHVRIATN